MIIFTNKRVLLSRAMELLVAPLYVLSGRLKAQITLQYSGGNHSRFIDAKRTYVRCVPKYGFVERHTVRSPSTKRMRVLFNYIGNRQSSTADLIANAPSR